MIKILAVTLSWLALLAALVGLGTFGEAIINHRDRAITRAVWLPAKYVHLNKQQNGAYFVAEGVSISGTAVHVAFDDSFKSLTANAAENDVIITGSAIHYLAKNSGVVYHASVPLFERHEYISLHDTLGDIRVGSDDELRFTIVAHNGDLMGIWSLLVLVFLFLLKIGGATLLKRTASLFPLRVGTQTC